MRRVIVALTSLWILSSYTVAAGWLHDYEEGLEKAAKEHKLVLMMYVKKT